MMHIKKLLIHYFSTVLFRVRITGESMWPVLVPGKTYLAINLLRVRKGDFIVFKNPKNQDEVFVKRVKETYGDRYAVESLVSWGNASEDFGLVGHGQFLGILWKSR